MKVWTGVITVGPCARNTWSVKRIGFKWWIIREGSVVTVRLRALTTIVLTSSFGPLGVNCSGAWIIIPHMLPGWRIQISFSITYLLYFYCTNNEVTQSIKYFWIQNKVLNVYLIGHHDSLILSPGKASNCGFAQHGKTEHPRQISPPSPVCPGVHSHTAFKGQ